MDRKEEKRQQKKKALRAIDVELDDEDMEMISLEVDRQLGRQRDVDVQAEFSGEGQPADVSRMQRGLRNNAHRRSDGIDRSALTNNERGSKGWALLPLEKTFVGVDNGSSRIQGGYKFSTRYMFDEGEDLALRAEQALGTTQDEGRAGTVIRFDGGLFRNADDQVVDTTGAEELNQLVHERKIMLSRAQTSATEDKEREEASDAPDQARIQALIARLAKLELKLAGAKQAAAGHGINAHHSVRGRHIFVMNAAGQFFAAQAEQWILHHSSFLAGGAVAAAGECRIEDGQLTAISNNSGHYKPGPAYLWQAVKQLQLLGCPLENVSVSVNGVSKPFRSALTFLAAMNPDEQALWFDSTWAVAQLDAADKGARRDRSTPSAS